MIEEDKVIQDGFIKSRWGTLDGLKSTPKRYWEQYAEWTIPSVFTKENTNESQQLQLDYDSTGAEAVNSMASNLGMTFFTPNRPFFRFEKTAELDEEAKKHNVEGVLLDTILAESERSVMKAGEVKSVRGGLTNAGKSVLITGNALLYMPKGETESMVVYGPKKWCVKRDGSGNMFECILEQCAQLMTFAPELQEHIKHARTANKDDDEVTVYTYMFRQGKRWITYEAAEGITLTDTRKVYNLDTFPYHIQVWNLIDGEDYGRGLVEDYAGAFHALSGVAAAQAAIIAMIADTKFLVDARGGVDVTALNKAPAGSYVAGSADAIKATTAQFNVPYQMIEGAIERYSRIIGRAFLVNSSMVRNAERVTAEEINFLRDQLTSVYGPQYSNISTTTQPWLAKMLMREVDVSHISRFSKITITTGIDSLARSADNEGILKWLNALSILNSIPDRLMNAIKPDQVSRSLAIGYGVKDKDYYKTDVELQADAKKEAMQAMAANVDPNQPQQPQQ